VFYQHINTIELSQVCQVLSVVVVIYLALALT
jgi:hypothetical protein